MRISQQLKRWSLLLIVALAATTMSVPQHVSAQSRDSDGDGIFDDVDECDTQPEDWDGYEDHDGCPEDGSPMPAPAPVVIADPFEALAREFVRVLATKDESTFFALRPTSEELRWVTENRVPARFVSEYREFYYSSTSTGDRLIGDWLDVERLKDDIDAWTNEFPVVPMHRAKYVDHKVRPVEREESLANGMTHFVDVHFAVPFDGFGQLLFEVSTAVMETADRVALIDYRLSPFDSEGVSEQMNDKSRRFAADVVDLLKGNDVDAFIGRMVPGFEDFQWMLENRVALSERERVMQDYAMADYESILRSFDYDTREAVAASLQDAHDTVINNRDFHVLRVKQFTNRDVTGALSSGALAIELGEEGSSPGVAMLAVYLTQGRSDYYWTPYPIEVSTDRSYIEETFAPGEPMYYEPERSGAERWFANRDREMAREACPGVVDAEIDVDKVRMRVRMTEKVADYHRVISSSEEVLACPDAATALGKGVYLGVLRARGEAFFALGKDAEARQIPDSASIYMNGVIEALSELAPTDTALVGLSREALVEQLPLSRSVSGELYRKLAWAFHNVVRAEIESRGAELNDRYKDLIPPTIRARVAVTLGELLKKSREWDELSGKIWELEIILE